MRTGFKTSLIQTTAIFLINFMALPLAAQSCRVPNIIPDISFSIIPYEVKFREKSTHRDLKRISRRHSGARHGDN